MASDRLWRWSPQNDNGQQSGLDSGSRFKPGTGFAAMTKELLLFSGMTKQSAFLT
jgi:hypothetical protein